MSILSLFTVTRYGQSVANNLTLFDFKQPKNNHNRMNLLINDS